MQIRKMAVFFLAILALGIAPFSFGQLVNQAQTPHRVLGYYNPATGVFEPLHQAASGIDPATDTTETGELIIKFTIAVKSTIPTNGVVGCSAEAATGDAAGEYDERATGVATLVSGKTYTCSAIIHYSWLLSTPTTDKITFTGSATIDYGYEVTAANGSANVVAEIESRGSTVNIGSIAVPASGATTNVDVDATL
jgi:hypothetical protein